MGELGEEDNIFTFADEDWNKPNKTEAQKKELSDRGKILSARQRMPLDAKVNFAKNRIRKVIDDYGLDKCVISFSGGKDSTVLSHIVLSMGYKIDHYFINTRLEYPECVKFVKEWTTKNDVKLMTMTPKIRPTEIWEKFGYPFFTKEVADTLYRLRKGYTISERRKKTVAPFMKYKDVPISEKCCHYLKKQPSIKFFKENDKIVTMIGTTAQESNIRRLNWIRKGCIYETRGQVVTNPIIFFTEKDIWEYIKKYKVDIAKVYAKGIRRTGCFCCGFGCHYPDGNNFTILKEINPVLYEQVMDKWGYRELCKRCDVNLGEGGGEMREKEIIEELKQLNFKRYNLKTMGLKEYRLAVYPLVEELGWTQ